jgi:signal transduction histidine kinase
VRVRVGREGGAVRVEVADDGRGAAADGARDGSGSGVPGMRERAAALGGTLEAGPDPGGGWRVRAELPA